MTLKIFIDSNVLAHWLILSKIKEMEEDKEKLWKEFEKLLPSYNFVELIFNSNLKEIEIHFSFLVFAEIISAIYDEYVCRKMRRDGIPLSSWSSARYKIKISDYEINQLVKDIEKFIELVESKKIIKDTEEIFDFELLSKLIFKHKLRTHDSYLISNAIGIDCNFFVTEDSELRKLKLKEIEIIHPQTMLNKLKKMHS